MIIIITIIILIYQLFLIIKMSSKLVYNIFNAYYTTHTNYSTLDILISIGLLKEELITRPIGLRKEYSYFIENTLIENVYTLVNIYNIDSDEVKKIEDDINKINPSKRVFVSSIEFLHEKLLTSIINKYMNQNINDTIHYINIKNKVIENFYDIYNLTLKHIKQHPFLRKENRIKENTITIDELFVKNTLLITNEDEVILLYFKEAHKYYNNIEDLKKIYESKIENSVMMYSLDDINIYKFYDAIVNRKLYTTYYTVIDSSISINRKNREDSFNITLSNSERPELNENTIKKSLYTTLLMIDNQLLNENIEIKNKYNKMEDNKITNIGKKRKFEFIENEEYTNNENENSKRKKLINYVNTSSSSNYMDDIIQLPLLKNKLSIDDMYSNNNDGDNNNDNKTDIDFLLLDSYKEYLGQKEDFSYISQIPLFNIENIFNSIIKYNLYDIEEYEYGYSYNYTTESNNDLELFIKEMEEKGEQLEKQQEINNINNNNKDDGNDANDDDDDKTESGGDNFDEETNKYFIEQEKYNNISNLPINEIILHSIEFKKRFSS